MRQAASRLLNDNANNLQLSNVDANGSQEQLLTCKCFAIVYHVKMTSAKTRTETFEAALRAAGVRMTRQRRTILGVLAETVEHPDANDLFRLVIARDTSISLSTVYRTMRILEDRGAIQRHVFDDGRARFEHADRDHHDHLIDIDNGKVIEFRSEKIEQLQAEIAAELGYEIVRHRLELYGRPLAKARTGKRRKG